MELQILYSKLINYIKFAKLDKTKNQKGIVAHQSIKYR